MLRERTLIGLCVLALAACSGGEDNEVAPIENGLTNAQSETPQATIADGLANADESRFRAAVTAAGLTATLAGPGEYTVLVPVDPAFERLPPGALDALMQPAGRERLTSVLTYRVLPGTILAADLGRAIDSGQGKAVLATMNGQTLTATREGERIVLTDASGAKASIGSADERFRNGVVHRIDALLTPERN